MIDFDVLLDETSRAFGVSELGIPALVDSDFRSWAKLSGVIAGLQLTRRFSVIGVSGSQGSGKSTFAQVLCDSLQKNGIRAQTVSIDDFYLTAAQRQDLAKRVHPLLATRGVPGTHDHAWLGAVLADVQSVDIRGGPARLRLPQFDKGLDDRIEARLVEADVLIVEGWCMGVTHQPEEDLQTPINALEREEDVDRTWRRWVNQTIETHYEPLWEQIGLWVHLRAPGFSVVQHWRTQQEQSIADDLRMNDAQLTRFVAHYERLTRWHLGNPCYGPGFKASLDEKRNVSRVTVASKSRI